MLRAVVLVLALAAATAAPAGAAFAPPVELASGGFGTSVVAATDEFGRTLAVVQGAGAAKLFERPSSTAAWAAPVPLPGRALGHVAGPVVSAAGAGAAAIAWRVDTPRRYGGIAAMVRAPGELFSEPALVAGADADGVRHPAVAVDEEGRAVLAFNTNTRAVHLSLKGAIAIALRGAHDAFGAPEVIDERPAGPPSVAIGPDGRGVVAWLRDRRVFAVSVDVEAGTIGQAKALTAVGGYGSVRAAAGPDGTATVAFIARRRDGRTGGSNGYEIAALRRVGAGTFPRRAQVVASLGRQRFVDTVAVAADAEGQTTVAWSAERFGGARRVGVNGVTSGVDAAVAPAGRRRFGTVLAVAPLGRLLCDPPTVAAAARRAVVAFACRDKSRWEVDAATIDRDTAGPSQKVMATQPSPNLFFQRTPVSAGLDRSGIATILAARPDPADPAKPNAPIIQRVLFSTGR